MKQFIPASLRGRDPVLRRDNKTTWKYFKVLVLALVFLIPIPLFTASVNLPVPFSPQAPDGKWIEPWRNACEETSTTLIQLYYSDYENKKVSIADAQKHILKLVNLEEQLFGFSKDTNAEQIVKIINNYLPWEAYVVENPTLKQLKQELDDKHPIIIVAHGKDLNNPHYKSDQIDYHAFVLSGYDDSTQEFISQEPATRFGLDYRYTYDTIMNAMHDFLPYNKTYKGKKIAVFTRKDITFSGLIDADNDGLNKLEEHKYGTHTHKADSDGDGYSDGIEVHNGYLPRVDEKKLAQENTLITSDHEPEIYIIKNKKKRHIANMQVFKNHGWDIENVKTVSEKFLKNHLITGDAITK